MNRRTILPGMIVSLSLLGLLPTNLLGGPIIDFEDWTGGSNFVSSATSGGFIFAADDVFSIQDNFSDASENDTLTLFNIGGGTITMTRDGGGVFDLLMADLGEGTLEAPSTSMLITGFFSDGGSISELLDLDGVLPDFEAVTFSGFSSLSSITFEAFGGIDRFSLDNIVVPEPGTLVFLGLGVLVAMRRPLRKWARMLSVFGVVLLLGLIGASELHAQWTGGPVLIGGDDTDDHFANRGEHYIREGFNFLGGHVTNGNTVAVCIGCNDDRPLDSFRDAFNASYLPCMMWTTENLTDVANIQAFFDGTGTLKIQDAGIIYLPTSGKDPNPHVLGGITQAQLNVVNANRLILKDFVKDPIMGGGGLFTHTLSGLTDAYDWLVTLVPEVEAEDLVVEISELNLTCVATAGFFPDLTPTEIMQINSGAGPWHTFFQPLPPATDFGGLVVLATGPDPVHPENVIRAVRQDILQFRARVLATWPSEDRTSKDSCALGNHARADRLSSGRGRTHAASCARGQTPRSNPLKWPRTLDQRLARGPRHQLARATSGWHVGHSLARFTSIRDWRAIFLAAPSSSGTRSPVPKYISSGV